MTRSEIIDRLLGANAPYWGGEAEVVRTYWDSPIRSQETDRLWLARQCFKEFWGGFMGPFGRIGDTLADLERTGRRREIVGHMQAMTEELSHYCLFADIHDALVEDDGAVLSAADLETTGDWPENAALMDLRARHKRDHGAFGVRAHRITEGGGCALYAEGKALRGRDGLDERIAAACARVHDDERGHMAAGLDMEDGGFDGDQDLDILIDLTVAQSRQRIRMRQQQFSDPVPPERLAELLNGKGTPLAIDRG